MARLPFNPNLITSQPDKKPTGGDQPWTVAQLAAAVRDALTVGLPTKVRVVGEISNLSARTHWFFSLKDANAAIRCVCFQSNARKVKFDVNDGMEVIATGRIDFYDAQGNVQLYVDKLEPVGVGELELRYRALCEELRGKGYFAFERKRELPPVPQCIAVITSRKAAALQDVINTAEKRWRGCRLMHVDVRVQGENAASEIAAAIAKVNQQREQLGIEAILLTRGGGSIEDLWAFNERAVADAVFKSKLPIVAAIGHETDTTIAELVADLRCATPTQAAMAMIPDGAALQHQVAQLSHRLSLSVTRLLEQHRRHLESLARHEWLRKPDRVYAPIRQRLEHITQSLTHHVRGQVTDGSARLKDAVSELDRTMPQQITDHSRHLQSVAERMARLGKQLVESQSSRLDAVARELEAVNPKRVLERGFSLTMNGDGQLVRKPADVSHGELIRTVIADGQIASRVEDDQGGSDAVTKRIKQAPVTPPPPRKKPARRGKRYDNDDDAPTLF